MPDGHDDAHVVLEVLLQLTSKSRLRVTPLLGKHDGPLKLPVMVNTPGDVGTWG